ncbi:hypothetical protein ALC56_09423 [Trachymyrmex septentrionalis]|uniref:Uncharacterized protein n=1 Tax=Trachymyrmex septentrionalis TaxID=34720 RepID=A0A195F8E5_9HYME|nr:hypothetical protein ALC56_09423 [Trachymyrmex septentrionalis]
MGGQVDNEEYLRVSEIAEKRVLSWIKISSASRCRSLPPFTTPLLVCINFLAEVTSSERTPATRCGVKSRCWKVAPNEKPSRRTLILEGLDAPSSTLQRGFNPGDPRNNHPALVHPFACRSLLRMVPSTVWPERDNSASLTPTIASEKDIPTPKGSQRECGGRREVGNRAQRVAVGAGGDLLPAYGGVRRRHDAGSPMNGLMERAGRATQRARLTKRASSPQTSSLSPTHASPSSWLTRTLTADGRS